MPTTFEVPVFDASGCFVSPGWIDLHAHVYEHATTLGVNPDKHCLRRGVTTVVDGGSAGAMTFAGLRHFVAARSNVRVLAFLHVASHGLAGAGCSGDGIGGESDHLNAIKADLCTACIRQNRDLLVGVKVRLDVNITDGGRNEHEVYLRAIEAARKAEVPLMVHRTNSRIPLSSYGDHAAISCPGSLQPGDIYTHCFHGHGGSILDKGEDAVDASVVRAQATGVIMDVGHGQGSFDWTVAERAAAIGMWPDTISSDLHSGNVDGPVHDLAHVMSKFLTLGMPFSRVIRAVTDTPAHVLRRHDELGSLSVGRPGDVTVFRAPEAVSGQHEPDSTGDDPWSGADAFGATRRLTRIITPVAVCREGRMFACSTGK